ncbi:MAG: hypothetical protein RMK80_09445, partial [Pseudobdellovibrionaceae bacterium]|nr:hypothetical protein [Pseudobdellovibrionaceae bacterium]
RDDGIVLHHRSSDLLTQDPELRYLLVFTGRPHHSGLNNFAVLTRLVERDQATWNAIKALHALSQDVALLLCANRPVNWLDVFNRELEARIRLAPTFSSREIDDLHREVQLINQQNRKTVVGMKILGAGGGGCVLIACKGSCFDDLSQKIERLALKVLPFHFI